MQVFFVKLNFKYKKVIILLRKAKNIGDDFMIYLLIHIREAENNLIEKKYIGICSTLEKAEGKVQEYIKYEGFERYPDGFKIKRYNINGKKENKEFKKVYFLGYHKEYKDETEDNEILGFFSTAKKAREYLVEYKIKKKLKPKSRGYYVDKWYVDLYFQWVGGFITFE